MPNDAPRQNPFVRVKRLIAAKRYPAADRLLRNLLRREPENARALADLARIAIHNNHPAGAVDLLERAVLAAPDNPDFRIGLVRNLWRSGQWAKCKAACQDALKQFPDEPEYHYRLAMVSRALKDVAEAEKAVLKAWELAPNNGLILASLDNYRAELVRGDEQGDPSRKRVALFVSKPFHYWILKPVFDVLSTQQDVIFTGDLSELKLFNPQVVFVSEQPSLMLRQMIHPAIIINTRHGLAAKHTGYFYASMNDVTCLSSPYMKEQYTQRTEISENRLWVTGYPPLDPLFRGETPDLPFKLSPDRQTVLYAPTFNPGLSSVPLLMDQLEQRLFGEGGVESRGVNLLIKPHPNVFAQKPEWVEILNQAAQTPNVFFDTSNPDGDLIPYLAASDIMITDASSAALLFLALDRPIIQITSPDRETDIAYNPKALEWVWRDMGAEIHDLDDLPHAIDEALAEPQKNSEKRLKYREALFGELTDGKAAERIDQQIKDLQLPDALIQA